MRRAEILATGDVQRVGFRDLVQNQEPYDVRIVAEGEEEALEAFIEALRIEEVLIQVRDLMVNPSNTSQICSGCGQIVLKDLSERVHKCPFCGLTLDRDHNAAINILRLGLQSVANA